MQYVLTDEIRTIRSCMYVYCHSEMENIVKDALERLKSNALGPVIYSPFTMRSHAVVAKTAAHILLLASRCKTQR